MMTTEPTKPTASPRADKKLDLGLKPAAAPNAPADANAAMVTLDQLAGGIKMTTRDARMLLRLAAKQTRQYPNLGKEHVARQPWQWSIGSKALDEARKVLTATEN